MAKSFKILRSELPSDPRDQAIHLQVPGEPEVTLAHLRFGEVDGLDVAYVRSVTNQVSRILAERLKYALADKPGNDDDNAGYDDDGQDDWYFDIGDPDVLNRADRVVQAALRKAAKL